MVCIVSVTFWDIKMSDSFENEFEGFLVGEVDLLGQRYEMHWPQNDIGDDFMITPEVMLKEKGSANFQTKIMTADRCK